MSEQSEDSSRRNEGWQTRGGSPITKGAQPRGNTPSAPSNPPPAAGSGSSKSR